MLVIFTLDIILTLAHVASYVKGTQVYQKEEKYYIQKGFYARLNYKLTGSQKRLSCVFTTFLFGI